MSVHLQWADRAGKGPSVIISTDPAVFELQGYQRGVTQQEQQSQKMMSHGLLLSAPSGHLPEL